MNTHTCLVHGESEPKMTEAKEEGTEDVAMSVRVVL